MMVSVLICSVNEERLKRVSQNIADTIGCEYELVSVDNTGTGKGLCRVYNELAAKAKGEYLCFMHEDVLISTKNWGVLMTAKASEPKTGIIGIVGSAVKTKALSGMMHKTYGESPIVSGIEGQVPKRSPKRQFSRSGLDWAPVVIVDGVLLFMRREVWERTRFDEQTFPGFHLYDMDISTSATMAGYTNYICNLMDVVHYTRGNYKNGWYEQTLEYHKKWEHVLPLYVNRPGDRQVKKDEDVMFFNITYHLLRRSNLPPSELWPRIKKQLREHPFYHKSWYHLYRFLRYKMKYEG